MTILNLYLILLFKKTIVWILLQILQKLNRTFRTFLLSYYILHVIETMSNAANYSFISNNVKGIQLSKKRLKLFEYLIQNTNSKCFIFFQETHSSLNDEKQLTNEINGPLFFSQAKHILAL